MCLAILGYFGSGQFWYPNLDKQFDLVNGIFGLCTLHKSCSPMSKLSNGIISGHLDLSRVSYDEMNENYSFGQFFGFTKW